MSGHSKWANIRRAKAVTDAKKAKIFTKLAHNIILAAQQGGGDPDINFTLRLAINRAKAVNMPSDNIERAIKRGTGESKDAQIISVTYEALGPGKTAVLIDCQSDNTNRALAEVRRIVEILSTGKLAPSGSVSWQFEERGLIVLYAQKFVPSAKFGKEGDYENIDAGDAVLELMEMPGVIDIHEETADGQTLIEVITVRESLKAIHTEILQKGYKIESAELAKIAKEEVKLDDAQWEELQQLLDKLDDSDEVTSVWHNADHV